MFRPHAYDGMNGERPPMRENDVQHTIDEPDEDDGTKASRWIGRRTIIVYDDENEESIHVRGVSATRRRLAP